MRGPTLIFLAVLLVCLGGVAWWTVGSGAKVDVPAPVFGADKLPQPEAVQQLKAAPIPVADVPDRNGKILLPDGTFVPALNGVETAVQWGKRSFSPIVGRNLTDTGVEWYVHEDGSQSTTVQVRGEGPGAAGIASALVVGRMSDQVFPLRPGTRK